MERKRGSEDVNGWPERLPQNQFEAEGAWVILLRGREFYGAAVDGEGRVKVTGRQLSNRRCEQKGWIARRESQSLLHLGCGVSGVVQPGSDGGLQAVEGDPLARNKGFGDSLQCLNGFCISFFLRKGDGVLERRLSDERGAIAENRQHERNGRMKLQAIVS
jgi:hypothetical protein